MVELIAVRTVAFINIMYLFLGQKGFSTKSCNVCAFNARGIQTINEHSLPN